jgi:hypothetical protein
MSFFFSPFHSNGLLPDAYSKTVSEWLRICRYIWIGKTNLLFFHDTINDLSPFRLPRGWSRGNLRRPFLPPIFRIGWVQGCGWLGPPLSFVLANAQVEAGVKGQLLQMTILHLSYVLSSLSPGPSIPNLSPYPILTVIASLSVCSLLPRVWVLLQSNGPLVLLLTEVLDRWDCSGWQWQLILQNTNYRYLHIKSYPTFSNVSYLQQKCLSLMF